VYCKSERVSKHTGHSSVSIDDVCSSWSNEQQGEFGSSSVKSIISILSLRGEEMKILIIDDLSAVSSSELIIDDISVIVSSSELIVIVSSVCWHGLLIFSILSSSCSLWLED
jgi:hypothetical protein